LINVPVKTALDGFLSNLWLFGASDWRSRRGNARKPSEGAAKGRREVEKRESFFSMRRAANPHGKAPMEIIYARSSERLGRLLGRPLRNRMRSSTTFAEQQFAT
jgi:hypothetical protein